jgi:hypothetical protein
VTAVGGVLDGIADALIAAAQGGDKKAVLTAATAYNGDRKLRQTDASSRTWLEYARCRLIRL